MKIKEIMLSDLKPYENNPRLNDKAVPAVAESLKQFGWQQPIVIDRNNVIVAGHTRYKAALKLGLEKVPCKYADELTEEQISAYRLADNKTAELAEWDSAKMIEELAKCSTFDMSAFGFEEEPEDPEEVIEDDYTEPEKVETRSKQGNIFQLGAHRLMCGDSTKLDQLKKVCESPADLLITDPPYNVGLGWHMRPSEAKQLHRRTDGLVIENDKMDDDAFFDFLLQALDAIKQNLKPGGSFYIWHADTKGNIFREACKQSGFEMRENLIWVKSAFAMGRQDYQWRHEPCLYGWMPGAPHYFINDRTQSTVFEKPRPNFNSMKKSEMKELLEKIYDDKEITTVLHEPKPAASELHPTTKPVRLISRLMTNSSKSGETILDPFGGSGTTMIAAEQLNRKCCMMELDPHYCDVIIDRWEKFTGMKAERVE